VSLAGASTLDQACELAKNPYVGGNFDLNIVCVSQGVHATFERGKLVEIGYWFFPSQAQRICEAFVEKYGTPPVKAKANSEDCAWCHSCFWMRGDTMLIVEDGSIPNLSTGTETSFTKIRLTSSAPSKDI
jgi:hypothetical protein